MNFLRIRGKKRGKSWKSASEGFQILNRSANGILFIGHDATRTGAPLILLELIKWLRFNTNFNIEIFLKKGGYLLSEYQAIAQTTCSFQFRSGSFNRLRNLLRFQSHDLHKFIPKNFPIFYFNTVDTCDVLLEIPNNNHLVIHHVHELEYVTQCCGSIDLMRRAIPVTDAYIAASDAVKQFLIEAIGVPEVKIHTVHEFAINTKKPSVSGSRKAQFRDSLGIPERAIVIGMCGTPEWRKGEDIFIELAKKIIDQEIEIEFYFIWIGGDSLSLGRLTHDSVRLCIHTRCRFICSKDDPSQFYELIDIFALTSREDPFPVAMLEAASYAVPVICFEGSGGGPEFVGEDAGVSVPYLDIDAMAISCQILGEDENLRRKYGKCGATKVENNYSLEIQARKILDVIERISNDCSSQVSGNQQFQLKFNF